jgi:hypothetical protein
MVTEGITAHPSDTIAARMTVTAWAITTGSLAAVGFGAGSAACRGPAGGTIGTA